MIWRGAAARAAFVLVASVTATAHGETLTETTDAAAHSGAAAVGTGVDLAPYVRTQHAASLARTHTPKLPP